MEGWEEMKFPGSLVVRTLQFHCQGRWFDPWLGIPQDMTCSQKKKKKKEEGIFSCGHSSCSSSTTFARSPRLAKIKRDKSYNLL